MPRAIRAGVDLGLEGDEAAAPLWVDGNAFLLREAISNLIDNAMAYAGANAIVTVRVSRLDDHAVLEVIDDGPGIPEADLARVFERFARATGQGKGCGLGLPIVREVLLRMGGTVEISNVLPRGLRAVVRLPVGVG